jgi:hypothetical protein
MMVPTLYRLRNLAERFFTHSNTVEPSRRFRKYHANHLAFINFLKLGERHHVGLLCHCAENERRLDVMRPAIAALLHRHECAVRANLRGPADRARCAYTKPYRRLAA